MTSRGYTLGNDLKEIARLMVDVHGRDAEAEAARRAENCRDIGDVANCELWWRIEAEIREILKAIHAGKLN